MDNQTTVLMEETKKQPVIMTGAQAVMESLINEGADLISIRDRSKKQAGLSTLQIDHLP